MNTFRREAPSKRKGKGEKGGGKEVLWVKRRWREEREKKKSSSYCEKKIEIEEEEEKQVIKESSKREKNPSHTEALALYENFTIGDTVANFRGFQHLLTPFL